jgi:hypothetical protein
MGPLGTVATNRPIVPTPGDYDDGEIGGMMIGLGNRSTRRKPTQCHFFQHKSHVLCPGANPGRRGGKPATNRLSYDTVYSQNNSKQLASPRELKKRLDPIKNLHSFISSALLLQLTYLNNKYCDGFAQGIAQQWSRGTPAGDVRQQ